MLIIHDVNASVQQDVNIILIIHDVNASVQRREDDPRVGGQWRIATLSRRGKCSPAAGSVQQDVKY